MNIREVVRVQLVIQNYPHDRRLFPWLFRAKELGPQVSQPHVGTLFPLKVLFDCLECSFIIQWTMLMLMLILHGQEGINYTISVVGRCW